MTPDQLRDGLGLVIVMVFISLAQYWASGPAPM